MPTKTITDLTDTDPGPVFPTGTLRWAFTTAADGDTIVSSVTGTIDVDPGGTLGAMSLPSVTFDMTGLTLTNGGVGLFDFTTAGKTVTFSNGIFNKTLGAIVSVSTDNSALTFDNCVFDSCNAGVPAYAVRSTTAVADCSLTINNSIVTGGKTVAVIYTVKTAKSFTLKVTNSVFSNNAQAIFKNFIQAGATVNSEITSTKFNGIANGSVYFPTSSAGATENLKVTSSAISGITSGSGAFTVTGGTGTWTFKDSSFSNNKCTSPSCGVISATLSAITTVIDSCTFTGNTNTGSKAGTLTGPFSISRSTISGNDIGVYHDGSFDLFSTILSNNTKSDFGGFGVLNSLGYNIYGVVNGTSGNTATDIKSSAPGLASITNNGGSTDTMALTFGSVAFNANKDLVTAEPSNDQRGTPFLRTVGAFQDIGAYERQAPSAITTQTLTYLEDTPSTNSLPNLFTSADQTSVTFNSVVVGTPSLFQSVTLPGGTTLTAVPAANQFGTTDFTITGQDIFGLTSTGKVSVTITPVNDAPSFTKGKDISVDQGGTYKFSSWATNISPGPNESSQTVSFNTAIVSTKNSIDFVSDPSIDTAGTLSFNLQKNTFGSANISVIAVDNGGTSNGGQDTSAAQYFTITLSQVVATKTPAPTKQKPSQRSKRPKPTPTRSDAAPLRSNMLELVDPTSALMLGVVAAKMATNFWSWATSLIAAKSENESKSIGDVKRCQSLLVECEKKIEELANLDNSKRSDSKWLQYSLEDLRDDLLSALKSRKLPTEDDVEEFIERMDALVEDYYVTAASSEPVVHVGGSSFALASTNQLNKDVALPLGITNGHNRVTARLVAK